MKRIRLIINSLICCLILFLIARFLDGYINSTARDPIYDKNSAMLSSMNEFIISFSGYEYYMHKYPENGQEILDFYYKKIKKNKLIKAPLYQDFKISMDRFKEGSMRRFGKPIRIIRLKEKPKSRLTDINAELPFVAYYIENKPNPTYEDISIYGCWQREEGFFSSNRSILISNSFNRQKND